MEKQIIAGFAILLLSAGVAVAQSSSSGHAKAGTSASSNSGNMQSSDSSDKSAATTTKKAHRTASSYPKAEARLNADEAQTTKQLNIQESQEVASNRGSGSTSSSSGSEMSDQANPSTGAHNDMSGGRPSSSASSSEQGSAASQPQ